MHIERPQTRIVNQQHVESEREVTGWEAEEILRKYRGDQHFSTMPAEQPIQNDNNLSFEEMVKREEEKRKDEEMRRMAKLNGPKPTTFDGGRGYESEVKWGSDDELGFGFKIEITTDMKLPKY
jgi:hypothetical protein